MNYNYKTFIAQLSGDYAKDLDAISDEVLRLQACNEHDAAAELLKYGEKRIAEHQSLGEENYRSVELKDEDYEKFYTLLQQVIAKVMEEDFKSAEQILLDIKEQTDLLTMGLDALAKGEHILSFQSLEEEILYRADHIKDKAPILGPELDIWLGIRGGIALELENYDEAQTYLMQAIKVNPMSVANHLSLSKIARIQGNYKQSREHNRKAFNIAYSASDFSACFSNEAYFLFKDDEPALALTFSMIALEYDKENIEAEGNILLIKGRYPDIAPAKEETFLNYIETEKIRAFIRPAEIKTLESIAEKMEEIGSLEAALEHYINLENLLKDDAYHAKIHELMHRIEDSQQGEPYGHHCDHHHGEESHCDHHHGEESHCCGKHH